ncbi:hypothetical protein Esti_000264 [Eimeria stiedai]
MVRSLSCVCCAAEETESACRRCTARCSKGPPRNREDGGLRQQPENVCEFSQLSFSKHHKQQQQQEESLFFFFQALPLPLLVLQVARRLAGNRAVQVSPAVLLPPTAAAAAATAAAGAAAASSTAAPRCASAVSPRSEASLHSAAESPRELGGGPAAPQASPHEARNPPIPSSSSSSSNSSCSSVGIFGWISRKLISSKANSSNTRSLISPRQQFVKVEPGTSECRRLSLVAELEAYLASSKEAAAGSTFHPCTVSVAAAAAL